MTKRLLTGLFVTAALLGCSKDKDDKKDKGRISDGFGIFEVAPRAATLKVTDLSGNPLVGAKILIGSALSQPYPDNFLATDANGNFAAPAAWDNPQPVTISMPGFIRATYLAQTPNGQTYQLRPLEGTGNFELTGTTTDFTVKNGDGLVDFGITAPAFRHSDFYSFDIWSVISPQNDPLPIIGQPLMIPSNVSIPKQRESYFLPLDLAKPTYRMYFRSKGMKNVITLRGQFPLKKVIDGIQAKKDFTELINDFNILGGSFRQVEIAADQNHVDLPVNEMTFSGQQTVQAPAFRDGEFILAAAVSRSENLFFPTDIKNLAPGQVANLRLGPGENSVLTVLKRKSESQKGNIKDRLSATLLPFTAPAVASLLPMMDDPGLMSSAHIQIPAVETIDGVQPVGTYASLSNLTVLETGAGPIASVDTVWEVYGAGWVNEVALPEWPKTEADDVISTDPAAGSQMRWGVTLMGQSISVGGNLEVGPHMLENATHATHSSVDF